MKYDAVVIGAGPAGSAAALAAAREGASCLMLEARRFPRYKPCAGGVTTRGQRLMKRLGMDPSPVVLSSTRFSVLHYRGEELRIPTSTAMTYREELDHHLARLAERAGAELVFGERVLSVKPSASYVEVVTAQGAYRASYVVACDGAVSRAAISLGLTPVHGRPVFGVLAEVDARELPWTTDELHLIYDPDTLPRGYAWAFPKGETVNIGWCCDLEFFKRNRKAVAKKVLPWIAPGLKALPRMRGGYIPAPRDLDKGRLALGRVLFAGDSAGVVEQWFYEGIFLACWSGYLAGRAAARGKPREYVKEVMKGPRGYVYYAAKFAETTYKNPSATFKMARECMDLMIKAADGDLSYREFALKALLRKLTSSIKAPFRTLGH